MAEVLNQNLQDPNSILQALNTITQQYAGAIPVPQLPSLNFNAPNVGDISGKWQEFLQRAAKDPDIVNYYNNLLSQAQGDTNLAISFLEKDYQTGTRQTKDNLKATLESLGLTFGQESNTMENTLNKRGIAMTDMGQGQNPQYAQGGQPATELGNLNQSQKLRQEAEQRSAGQKVENMGLTRQKGISSAGQQLQQYGTSLNQQKQQDVLNRANTYMGAYQNQQSADLAQKQNSQNLVASGGATPPSFKPNTQNQTVQSGGVTWRGQPGADWEVA